jgi:hypothetical protein
MLNTLNSIWLVGVSVNSFAGLPTPTSQSVVRRHDIPRTIRPNARCWISLPSQSALRLRELVGASRRCASGPSLGELTSAGASNSQVTQQMHATDADGIPLRPRSKGILPSLCFSPSASSITRFKNNSKKIGEGLCGSQSLGLDFQILN